MVKQSVDGDQSPVNTLLVPEKPVRRAIGNISRATMHRLRDEDEEFPKPVALRPGASARYFVWAEVLNYVDRLIERRDQEGASPSVVARGRQLARRRTGAAG